VAVPKGHSDLLNSAAPLMICHKMSTSVHLIDPLTLRGCDIPAYEYWKKPFEPAATRTQMTTFIVLNTEEIDAPEVGTKARHHLAGRNKMRLADIEVARECDFGVNDDRLIVRSHLGAILRPGNRVLGYDLRFIQIGAAGEDQMEKTKADVFLVKKVFCRKKGRAWELKRLERDREEGEKEVDDDKDMEAMKRELEEDPELRRHVNMYSQPDAFKPKAAAEVPVEESEDEEEENAPEVPLAELLEGLELGGGVD